MEYRVITLSDRNYPRKIKERLGDEAPEKIYYNGKLSYLDRFTMAVICSDKGSGIEYLEMSQLLYTIQEYSMNYIGGWHSFIEGEIFSNCLFMGYKTGTKYARSLILGKRTLTLFSAKGLMKETYKSYFYDRHASDMKFPEKDEYFRRAEEGELLMLSVCKPDEGRQNRKNIMERNWLACVLGDIVFIPCAPKGTKTYITAKKVVEANIPAFTTEHPTSADLHKIGIPGFNRKSVRKFLEDKGAKLPEPEKPIEQIEPLPYKIPIVKKPAQAKLF
ncbi:MAG: hypothetical protein HY279_00875 [Nitrospinae bacterium]|nr:hypothetical protein [Nitrospinota bacterium]